VPAQLQAKTMQESVKEPMECSLLCQTGLAKEVVPQASHWCLAVAHPFLAYGKKTGTNLEGAMAGGEHPGEKS
jgi:hypothetical protein